MTEQIRSLRQTRARLVAEAQALIPKDGKAMTAEQRSKFDTMFVDAETLKGTIGNLEQMERETRAVAARNAHNPRPQSGAVAENREALRRFMVDGVPMESRAALSTATGNAGLSVINQTMFPFIVDAKKSYSGVGDIAYQWETETGIPCKTPFVNDTANEATEGQDAVASTEVEPPITSTLSYVDDFDSGYSLITVAELQDSNYDVESFVSQKLMQRIYRKLSAALVAGSTNIQSVITTATNAASSSAQTSVTWADLTALMANLDEAYQAGASFAMNQTTKFALAAMVDTLGRPIFTASAGAEQFDSILGKPIHVSVNHPNMGAGVVGAIQYGAWDQAYCLRSVADMHLFRLTERFLPDYSSYAYLVKARFGGFALNAGTNPVYNLVNHA